MMRRLLPLALFLALAVALAAGLSHDPRALPSALVGQAAPAFELPVLDGAGRRLAANELRGQVWLFNVWASWCAPCQAEHPVVADLARRARVPVYGLNYKDQPAAAREWLRRLGNPYAATLLDPQGRTGIDWGVYGVPETFVVDGRGIVRLRLAGPLTPEIVEQKLLPLLLQLRQEGGHA
ncbi:DsbE family thiol:disulfide interchange protein [Ramlibacter sp. G-1-2-2]|uniref:DsbE family thiol:disulfide interchange protein n=1 Tax=Ramlibacter agri TaxID=2728837 RepID=A0A848H867_9BURK|nr:DsbE family thiol:disulfide interchange protein [Ramlibacter agri]NML45699.1 DsbE family thiol:disulfide interchange protein [Ramlibacter agri]